MARVKKQADQTPPQVQEQAPQPQPPKEVKVKVTKLPNGMELHEYE
jgi:hypothetical protein